MAAGAAKINIKNIDYFKFKKIVIDGNRDDYSSCSREVKALCDCVQTLTFRDEEFDPATDRGRFEEILTYYKQIIASKRIESLDMRVKNGWWAESKSEGGGVCSANKFKAGALKVTLVMKTRDWMERRGCSKVNDQLDDQIEGPGVFVFKHKERQCFQYIGFTDRIFTTCSDKLKAAFDGLGSDPLASLLVISMAADWDFYFIPTSPKDDGRLANILQNDFILKHDSIWPHGLNFTLNINTLLEISEFRKSCLRHHWPPESDVIDKLNINIDSLRSRLLNNALGPDTWSFKVPEMNGSKYDDDGESNPHRVQSTGSSKSLHAPAGENRRSTTPVSTSSSKSKMANLKPPSSPKPSPRSAAQIPVPARSPRTSDSSSSAVNRPNSAARLKTASTSEEKPSKLPSKMKPAKVDMMSMSLDAAQCRLAFNPDQSPDIMTSSVMVTSRDMDMDLNDDVMMTDSTGHEEGTTNPVLPEELGRKSKLPSASDAFQPDASRSRSMTSLGANKELKEAARKKAPSTPSVDDHQKSPKIPSIRSQKVDESSAKIRASSVKDAKRAPGKKLPTVIPAKRPLSAKPKTS